MQDYFVRWAGDAEAGQIYSAGYGRIARLLREAPPEGQAFVSGRYASDLDRFVLDLLLGHPAEPPRWFDGAQCLVLPPPGEAAAYYFPSSAPPTSSGSLLLGSPAGPAQTDGAAIYRMEGPKDLVPPRPMSISLGPFGVIHGFDLPPSARAGEELLLSLYWEALETGPGGADYVFFVHLVDEHGLLWAQAESGGFPAFDWRAGDRVIQDASLSVPPETPPGVYELLVGMYDRATGERLGLGDPSGSPLGSAVRLGSVDLAKASRPPDVEDLPIAAWRGVHLGPLELLGFDCGPPAVRAGESLQVTLFWRAAEAPAVDYRSVVVIADEARTPLASFQREPLDGDHPTGRWAKGDVCKDIFEQRVPPDLPAGKYGLRLQLLDPSTGDALRVAETGHDSVPIGSFEVLAGGRERRFETPSIEHVMDASFDGKAILLGYDLEAPAIRAGETVSLTLYWQAASEMARSYTVFTHLLDSESRIFGQVDNPPVGGAYPTDLWAKGEVVADPYRIQVGQDAPPGSYVVEVGLYDPATGERLPVVGAEASDRILLGSPIVVE